MSAGGRRVFLTGATGFIGSRLARRLAERGDHLVCLVRESSDTRLLRELGAELVTGDIDHGDLLARAMDGAELACHLAAIYDVGAVDEDALERTNVHGTRAFLGALAEARVARALYVSSTVAFGPTGAGARASARAGERLEAGEPPYRSAYERTKAEAHRLARQAQEAGLPVIIVAPAFVYGPGDEGPAGRFILDLLRGRVPGLLFDPAWFSFIYVDDVVDGLLAAADRGRVGQTYVLGGEDASMNDFAERVCRLAGKRAPRLRFPVPLARLTGMALDPVARLTGARFPISRESVDTTGRHRWLHPHAGEETDRALGLRARPLEEGLPPTVAWAKEQIDRRQMVRES